MSTDDEEVHSLKAELERKVAEVAALNQELEAFSYSVSHDLRAPLRHINGFAGLMQKNAATLDEKHQRYLQSIIEAAAQMEDMMNDLLSLARLSNIEMQHTRVDLEQLAREVRDEVLAQSEGRSISWKIGSLPQVEGDPTLLRMVLVNLISNAVKYTRPRTHAHIEIGYNEGEAGEVVCFVRDNGVGFDMRYSGKLFGAFQRLHRVGDFEGTGTGLANVRRIVHRHGGRVWATGAVDEGATFYFSLPQQNSFTSGGQS